MPKLTERNGFNMILETTFKIGEVLLKASIEGKALKDCLFQAGCITNIRRKCDVCGATTGFKLIANKADSYEYVNVECACGAKSNLGTYKDGSGNYWKEFEKYEPKGQN